MHACFCTHITEAHRITLHSLCLFPQPSIREALVSGNCPGPFLFSDHHEEILTSTAPPPLIYKWEKGMWVWFLLWVSEVSHTVTGDVEMEPLLSVWGPCLVNCSPSKSSSFQIFLSYCFFFLKCTVGTRLTSAQCQHVPSALQRERTPLGPLGMLPCLSPSSLSQLGNLKLREMWSLLSTADMGSGVA